MESSSFLSSIYSNLKKKRLVSTRQRGKQTGRKWKKRIKEEGNFLCHIFGILLHTTTGCWCNYIKRKIFLGKGNDESRKEGRHRQNR